MKIKYLTLGELQRLSPIIHKQWHSEKYAVFLALLLKERAKAGDNPAIMLVAACELIMQWVEAYLKDHQGAVAKSDDYKPIVISLLEEVMTLKETLP